jgi:hypothetical protein
MSELKDLAGFLFENCCNCVIENHPTKNLNVTGFEEDLFTAQSVATVDVSAVMLETQV